MAAKPDDAEPRPAGKLPAFMFYPGDWLRDPAVRACGFAARGLWIDMLGLMWNCEPRGYLTLNGNPVNASQLARMTGGTVEEVTAMLSELETAGVFSRTPEGSILNRRMVRDEHARQQTRDRVKRFRARGSDTCNADVTGNVTRAKRPGTEGEIEGEIASERMGVQGEGDDGFDAFWAAFPRKVGKEDARKAWKKLAPDAELRKTILAAVERQKTWPQWQGDSRYIPHPSTWLNGRRWLDEPPTNGGQNGRTNKRFTA